MSGKREKMSVEYSQPPLAHMTQWCIEICIDQTKDKKIWRKSRSVAIKHFLGVPINGAL